MRWFLEPCPDLFQKRDLLCFIFIQSIPKCGPPLIVPRVDVRTCREENFHGSLVGDIGEAVNSTHEGSFAAVISGVDIRTGRKKSFQLARAKRDRVIHQSR